MSKHTKFIRSLPCVVCGDLIQTECAHIRFAEPRLQKPNSRGLKPPDYCTIPLCSQHHRAQHETSEKDWWTWWRLDPHFISLSLYVNSGNYLKCCRIIEWHQDNSSRCLDLKTGIMQNMLSKKINI